MIFYRKKEQQIAEKFIMSLGTVTLWVMPLVFMFFMRIRFSVKHSIVNVLWKNLVQNVR